MNQPDLLSWTPPASHRFLGSTITEADVPRLNKQLKAVHDVMVDGRKRCLRTLADDAGCPEASASARFRDLKRLGFPMCKENVGDGLWLYWLDIRVKPPPQPTA